MSQQPNDPMTRLELHHLRECDGVLVIAASAGARKEDRSGVVVAELQPADEIGLPDMLQRRGDLVDILGRAAAQSVIVFKVLGPQREGCCRLELVLEVDRLAAPIPTGAGL